MNLFTKFNKKGFSLFQIENIYFLVLIILFFLTDRLTKIEILKNFSEKNYFFNEFINFDLIWNTGIGFGFLSFDSSLLYNSITVLVGAVILFLFYISIFLKKLDKLIFSFIIGGALGNFYDRLIYNAVPDFIDLHYSNFHWFTFNVADIFITLGVVSYLMKGAFVAD
jgi:signal peptidase II